MMRSGNGQPSALKQPHSAEAVESNKKRVTISRKRRARSKFPLPLPYCATRPELVSHKTYRNRTAAFAMLDRVKFKIETPDLPIWETSQHLQFAAQAFQDVVIKVLDHALALEAGRQNVARRHTLGQGIFSLAEITFGFLGVVAIGQGETANPSATRIFKDLVRTVPPIAHAAIKTGRAHRAKQHRVRIFDDGIEQIGLLLPVLDEGAKVRVEIEETAAVLDQLNRPDRESRV